METLILLLLPFFFLRGNHNVFLLSLLLRERTVLYCTVLFLLSCPFLVQTCTAGKKKINLKILART
jgi:hypothetical protein